MISRSEKCCLYDGDAISLLQCKFYFLLPKPPVEGTHDSSSSSVKRTAEDTSTEGDESLAKKSCV